MDPLKSRLLLLESHFTWALSEEDFSLHDLVNRLREQIELELKSGEARVTRSYCSLAYVRYLYGDLVEALADLSKSEDHAKRHFGERSEKFLMVTYGDFAWLYFHMGKVSLAEDYLKKVDEIRVKFGSSNEVHNEVLREKGWAFLKFSRKYYNGAGECFRLALETNPDDRDLNAGYAIALYRTTLDPPGSRDSMTIAQLKRAIDLNPEDAVLLVFLALRLIQINKSPSSPHSKVQDPFQMIESVEAIMLVAKALKMSPENPHVMRYVAIFCRKLGSVDFAICQLEKTLVHTPDSAFTYHQLGVCYMTKKIEFEKKYGHCRKTENYEAQNCLRKSIYLMERAVSLKPTFIVALATLAVQYGQMGNILKAEELFQQAFQLAYEKKEHLQVVYELYGQFQLYSKRSEQSAIYYYMEGLKRQDDKQEWERCEKELREIAEHRAARDPKDSKSYAIEGFIHELKGEKLNAEACYKKALTTGVAIGESPLLTELRVWLLAFKGAEERARNVILDSRSRAEEVLGFGRPVLQKGTMAKKTVCLVETDLCNAKKILPRERSLLAPGPHAIVLAFLHEGQLKKTRSVLQDLEIFGRSFWKHVIVLFTNKTTSLKGSVAQWLLQKCGGRFYIAGVGTRTAQAMEFSERIMTMISRNKTMHLIVPALVNRSFLKMVTETESENKFTPEVITEEGQLKYRFLCKHAGWFHCSFTRLGFRMNGEGEVVYRTVDEDSSCSASPNQYSAGPLYDITCVGGQLSHLQLPHCEISPDDCRFMTVEHYTEGKVEVLKADYITHTHVSVRVPGLSLFQLKYMLNWFKGKIRGQLILTYYPLPKHRLHVFLRPHNTDLHKLLKKGSIRLEGAFDTNLKHGHRYNLTCEDVEQQERQQKIQDSDGLFLRHIFTDNPTFVIHLERNTMNIKLHLKEKGTDKMVWGYDLPDLREYQDRSTSSDESYQRKITTPDKKKCMDFFLGNWDELVQKVTNVDAILDRLVRFICSENINEIRNQSTPQAKTRALLNLVGKTLSPQELYRSLADVHPDLVKDML
ncbi:interferon-induced protein with tetratricopeptide repeats 5 [Astyanax mexicanus]|uniref:interferon-induced protein with tetratricopeptide repeats 5 n=1 Tax=Astyanax mexicanus TaxID=7994 RepID=UPI0020CAEE6D|nr:interferon-induced protein with tetratricopeptide repeats 5 [Astyanax mexicanus]